MNVQKAIFPGILFSCLLLILLSGSITNPQIVHGSPSNKENQTGDCTISDQYPQSIQKWCPIILANTEGTGLEAELIAAVMLQESGGNPQAYSSSGAVGLMQIMPRDGIAASFICQNGPCFASRPTMQELYDPEYNIAFGTRMLAGLVNKYGNHREALKAYGPMDVGYYYADLVLSIMNRY
ncbi:MAG: transglycosylase SLT domain-containing protein [Anaerolineaceae bacterium]|nr:transglycosylase SLT domain-containing protein [Anaerolineaceae bacterium]